MCKGNQQNALVRFKPYYRYLLNVKWTFIAGVFAGIVYGVSSGLGLPLATKYIFPILFDSDNAPQSLIGTLSESTPSYLIPIFSPVVSGLDSLYQKLLTLPKSNFLLITCLFLPITFIFRAAGGYFNHYLINKAGLKVLEQIRSRVFARLQELSLNYFHKTNSGDIITRLQGSSDVIRATMMGTINDLIIQPVTLISAVGFLIWQAFSTNGALPAMIGIAGIPLAVLPIKAFGKKIKKRALSAQKMNESLSSFIIEHIQSPLEVRAFNQQQKHQDIFDSKNHDVLRNNLKVQKYSRLITPVIEVLAVLGLSFAIYLGVQQGMTLETFTALAVALYIAYEPVKKLGKLSAALQNGVVALDRLESILHSTEEIPETKHSKPFKNIKGEIQFRQMSFSYDGVDSTLINIDLKIPAGEIVALVGPSGAGKTSFVNMIPRFYDPTAGSISIDGINLKDVSKNDLREQIAIVPQMPTLFNMSIRENILIGKANASQAEVEQAAKEAYAHDFIMQLPQGYDTLVTEGGTSLSGGQQQRISIARAFLKNSSILLLDEATSALDNESQEKITLALQELMKGKTVLMIAHRESSLTAATRRLTFEEGEIVKDEVMG